MSWKVEALWKLRFHAVASVLMAASQAVGATPLCLARCSSWRDQVERSRAQHSTSCAHVGSRLGKTVCCRRTPSKLKPAFSRTRPRPDWRGGTVRTAGRCRADPRGSPSPRRFRGVPVAPGVPRQHVPGPCAVRRLDVEPGGPDDDVVPIGDDVGAGRADRPCLVAPADERRVSSTDRCRGHPSNFVTSASPA